MNSRRLSVRDYKKPRRGGLPLEGSSLRPFAFGLLLGLAIAAAVYVNDHRTHAGAAVRAASAASQTSSHGAPGAAGNGGEGNAHGQASAGGQSSPDGEAASTAAGTGTGLAKYDFYQMLPRSQLLIPGRESDARPLPGGQIDRPGVYVLQIGSYRDAAVAERVRAQAQKLGVTASIQLVVVNTATWHRVRVETIHDLTVLNRVRRQLLAGDLEALVVRVNP